jgi:hypothetical protein
LPFDTPPTPPETPEEAEIRKKKEELDRLFPPITSTQAYKQTGYSTEGMARLSQTDKKDKDNDKE